MHLIRSQARLKRVYYRLHKRKLVSLWLATAAASIASISTLVWASALQDPASKATARDGPPEWAYGTAPSAPQKSTPLDPSPQRVPLSKLAFTRSQIMDPYGPADWFPPDHPAMPAIVSHGRRPPIWACGLCHYPNGKGRPENAGVAGLPVSYFIHQMHDFREGLRTSADIRKKNTNLMIAYAKAMTDDEIKAAATYYGGMPWTPWIRVVEASTVPKTRLSVGMYLPLEIGGREPIGRRIIEMPEDAVRTEELRDPRSGFIAYVPPGSVRQGERLVKTGGDRTQPCGLCHGVGLLGLGPIPGIAGRSPSYLARQMFDMKKGTRKGEWTELMKPVVAHLTDDDVLDIVAYTASLRPQ
jgi:cytochrome c553